MCVWAHILIFHQKLKFAKNVTYDLIAFSARDKILPSSAGARYKHYTMGVHAAAYVWSQDLMENPNIPDPFKVGWLCDADKIFVPILSDIAITQESVVELVRCGC